jgi:hypothetical protein
MSTDKGEKGMSSRLRRVIWASLLPALIAGGIAFAAQGTVGSSGKSGASKSGTDSAWPEGPRVHKEFIGPAPGLHRSDENLTYGEMHVRRNGNEVVIRIDRGKVKSTSSDSVTITENDGSDVTIPVDGDTKVFAGFRNPEAKVTDLKVGQVVTTHREQGKPADFIGVEPKFPKGMLKFKRGLPPGPPPPGFAPGRDGQPG